MAEVTESQQALALYGKPMQPKIPVAWKQIPLESLKVAPRGSMYTLELDVSDLTAEKAVEALNTLAKELKEKFNIQIIYGAATKNRIYLQIKGSPFSWLALLAFLPTILGLIGVILFAVTVWQAVAAIPSWVWSTLIISGALILLGPPIGEWIISQVEKARARKL